MAKRKLGSVILGILIGGVLGSALSFLLAKIFPNGPVKSFFFSALKVGFSTVDINLGFLSFSLGLNTNITLLTAVFVFLFIYLLHKL